MVIPNINQLVQTIEQAEFNQTDKRQLLTAPYFENDERRGAFLRSHIEDLGAAITLLRAITNPSVCTPRELIDIIRTKSEVFASVSQFVTAQIPGRREFLENIRDVSFKRTYPGLT